MITLYPQYTKGNYTDNTAKFVFAHELFHCIQFTWSSMAGDPEWLVEGSAEFAALDLYRSTFQPVPTQSHQEWFTDTGRPLGQEPIGEGYGDWALFEAYWEQYHTDPYPAIKAMIQTGGSTAGIVSAGHLDDQTFETLSTSTSLRSTDYADAVFQLSWPGVQPGYGKRDTALDLGSRGVGEFSVVGKADFVHQQYTVELGQDVGIVGVVPDGGPLLTHANSGAVTVGEGQQEWFCVRSGGCTCPNGTGMGAELPPLTPPMLFSFAAGAKASSANVTAAEIVSSPDQTPPSTATAGGAAPLGASLTLSGTLDPNDQAPLTGTMPLAAGTVVVFKAECPSDPNTDVAAGVTNLQTNRIGLTAVCGPRWKAVPNLDATGAVHSGESYVFIYQSGTYGISVQADNHDPANPGTAGPFTLQVESSPTPTVITPPALTVGTSQTITLRSPGDTIAMEAAPGSDGGTWTFTANDQLCTQTYPIDALSNGANDDPVDLDPSAGNAPG